MDRENRSTPLLAGLIGGLVASLTTLTAVYLANQENRKRIGTKLDELRKSLDQRTVDSRSGVSQQLRSLADKIETKEVKELKKEK